MDHNAKVDALMRHTGLAAKIEAAAIASRLAACAEARAKKRAEYKKFDAERMRLAKILESAEASQIEAQKQAEARMFEMIKVRHRFSDIHEHAVAANKALDAELRKNADPAIAEFVAELRHLETEASSWSVENASTINQRIRSLRETSEAAERLIIDMDCDDVAAAIKQLRESIRTGV